MGEDISDVIPDDCMLAQHFSGFIADLRTFYERFVNKAGGHRGAHRKDRFKSSGSYWIYMA